VLTRCFSIDRVLEISDQVRQVLNQPNSQCTIAPAPADSAEADSAVALAKRCLCKVTWRLERWITAALELLGSYSFRSCEPCDEAYVRQQSLVWLWLGARGICLPALCWEMGLHVCSVLRLVLLTCATLRGFRADRPRLTMKQVLCSASTS